jgi:hypothetical protein
VGADEIAILCDGDPSVVEAAHATSGVVVELWTVRRASRGAPAIGAAFDEDPLVPRIDAVSENSVARRMGLRVGDVLVRIGDQALDGVGTEAVIELWLQRFAGAELGVLRASKIVMLRPQG